MDLPAMSRCKVSKSGRHHIGAVLPGEDTGDITFYCEACCIIRRVPAKGSILGERLDDLTAAEIERLIPHG